MIHFHKKTKGIILNFMWRDQKNKRTERDNLEWDNDISVSTALSNFLKPVHSHSQSNPKTKPTKKKTNNHSQQQQKNDQIETMSFKIECIWFGRWCVCVGNIINFEVLSCYHAKPQLNEIGRLVVVVVGHLKLQEGTLDTWWRDRISHNSFFLCLMRLHSYFFLIFFRTIFDDNLSADNKTHIHRKRREHMAFNHTLTS